jgi:pimeloyl-ACP methyl ester carboxylesterase
MLKRVVLGLAVLIGLVLFGWLPYWLGGVATTRKFEFRDRENAGLTPASFGLAYEDVAFQASDGAQLTGWWVPSSQNVGTVVLVHGLNRSRIEMVRKVPFLNRAGWNAVLFDLRHHGKSGGSTSSFGFFEKQDVLAAKVFARTRSHGPVVLWGVSLGAASALLAAADDSDVAGLVCDSTYRSLRDTVSHHLRLARSWRWWARILPSWPVADEVVYWIGRRGGFDPDAVNIAAAASHLAGRPCLFVCNSGDRRMPSEIAFELQRAVGDKAKVLVVPGKSHGGAYREGTAAYESAVSRLLQEARGEAAGAQYAEERTGHRR